MSRKPKKKPDNLLEQLMSILSAPNLPPAQGRPQPEEAGPEPNHENGEILPGPTSQPASRVTWHVDPEPEPAAPVKKSPSSAKKIEWGGAGSGGIVDLQALIGVEDAFDHTILQPGEKIAFCQRDKVAYHLETWQFLKAQNRGRCCICGQPNVMAFYTLPGVAIPGPAVITPLQPVVPIPPGEKAISLPEVPDYVNRAVTVQDYVYEVYRSKNKGTHFIRFEPREYHEAPFQGFKVVIFSDYVSRWESAGISIDSYARQHIRVRGIVQMHPKWGIEILVNSPRVIQIVEATKEGGEENAA